MSTRPQHLHDVHHDAVHCSYCPKMCRFACPVAAVTGRESATPWGINRAIAAAADHGEVDDRLAAAAWACTGCRACGSACLPGLDLPTHVRAARADVAAAGLQPDGAGEAAGRPAAAPRPLADRATPGAAAVVLVGCRADAQAAAALGEVLDALGVDFDVPSGEVCCGARSADVGWPRRADEDARHVGAQVAAAERLIVADPHCARWLRVDRGDARVRTVAEELADALDPDRLADDRVGWPDDDDPEVVVHDPCWLARGLGDTTSLRRALRAAGVRLAEVAGCGERTECAGGGMGMAEVDPQAADAMRDERAAQLAASAGTVVTACPTAQARLAGAGLVVRDVAEELARRLGGPEGLGDGGGGAR